MTADKRMEFWWARNTVRRTDDSTVYLGGGQTANFDHIKSIFVSVFNPLKPSSVNIFSKHFAAHLSVTYNHFKRHLPSTVNHTTATAL